MSTESGRTQSAIEARRTRTDQMLDRLRTTLAQMLRDNMEIEVAVVARRADVSRTFLYQNDVAKQALAEAKSAATPTPHHRAQPVDLVSPWKERALNTEAALRTAYAEISSQRDQIGRLLGQIRDLEVDLPADAVERITTENRALRQDNRTLTAEKQRLTDRLKSARENNRFLDARVAGLEADLAEHLDCGRREPAPAGNVAHMHAT